MRQNTNRNRIPCDIHSGKTGEPWPVKTRISHFSMQYSSTYKSKTFLSTHLMLFHLLLFIVADYFKIYVNYFLSISLLVPPLAPDVWVFPHQAVLQFSVDTKWVSYISLSSKINSPQVGRAPSHKTAHPHLRC